LSIKKLSSFNQEIKNWGTVDKNVTAQTEDAWSVQAKNK